MLSLYVLNAPLQDEEGGKVCSLIVGTFNSKMILHVGLNQKLSHPFGSCDSCRFIISNFKFGVEVQNIEGQRGGFVSFEAMTLTLPIMLTSKPTVVIIL